ncbi:ABC transporter substrate-binding protein [Streptomyces spiramenti]|uniref:ABC transporter substrate-binding protein n=1 Tax=Streptomyces spiramenti TaxID=2720606 RepID=A0ABX1APY3_9ACTN|nr:ABC transporter substrate-binding protein [Streptomyces spiramenti]NJP68206.1 ABC transporter substrate-binding protein [Streptomyces spiramenti]
MDTQTVKSARTTLRRAPLATAATALTLALALTACGGESLEESGSGSDTDTGSDSTDTDGGDSLVIGSADFTEATITAELYAQILADAGFDTEVQTVRGRELYAPALESGEINIVPEYLATTAEYFNRDENGPDAEPVASSDPEATREALIELVEPRGLTVLDYGDAVNQNAFAVSEQFAEEHGLETLTDLGESGLAVRLAAGEDCVERPFCQPGLERVYDIDITEVDPKGVGTAQTKQSIQNRTNELALVTTTDGTLADFGLVLLEDDQNLQQADNILPVLNTETAENQEVVDILNELTSTLTTDDLVELNRQVDAERVRAVDAAREYLVDKGLIDG